MILYVYLACLVWSHLDGCIGCTGQECRLVLYRSLKTSLVLSRCSHFTFITVQQFLGKKRLERLLCHTSKFLLYAAFYLLDYLGTSQFPGSHFTSALQLDSFTLLCYSSLLLTSLVASSLSGFSALMYVSKFRCVRPDFISPVPFFFSSTPGFFFWKTHFHAGHRPQKG